MSNLTQVPVAVGQDETQGVSSPSTGTVGDIQAPRLTGAF